MGKSFVGARVRRLREERGLTQAAVARAAGLSAAYVNQIERDQRPLTANVLPRLAQALGVDPPALEDADEARLILDLRMALAGQGAPLSAADLRALALGMPGIARSILTLQRRLREATERADLLGENISVGAGEALAPTAFEAVRDWFYDRRNHVAPLDEAGERLGASLPRDGLADALAARLVGQHDISIGLAPPSDALRRFDPGARVLHLSERLSPGQRAFQMATQLALLEQGRTIEALVAESGLVTDAAALLRIGLANYFAGAVILPYTRFRTAAEAERYDIELLARRFGVGFETACHRLSTLQRQGAEGVPFFFIRVDRAGNISKRQSATDFHFSRYGGACPLWNVYEAFSRPGELLTQLAEMPDGRRYLWVARTVDHGQGGFGAPRKQFAVALGCDLSHAAQLVYGRGLDLAAPVQTVTPIGPGCKLCERAACPQRAFPMVGRPLDADPTRRAVAPYAVAE